MPSIGQFNVIFQDQDQDEDNDEDNDENNDEDNNKDEYWNGDEDGGNNGVLSKVLVRPKYLLPKVVLKSYSCHESLRILWFSNHIFYISYHFGHMFWEKESTKCMVVVHWNLVNMCSLTTNVSICNIISILTVTYYLLRLLHTYYSVCLFSNNEFNV